jgi:hypothetical protein
MKAVAAALCANSQSHCLQCDGLRGSLLWFRRLLRKECMYSLSTSIHYAITCGTRFERWCARLLTFRLVSNEMGNGKGQVITCFRRKSFSTYEETCTYDLKILHTAGSAGLLRNSCKMLHFSDLHAKWELWTRGISNWFIRCTQLVET